MLGYYHALPLGVTKGPACPGRSGRERREATADPSTPVAAVSPGLSGQQTVRVKRAINHALPANSPVSVYTFTRSPSWMYSGALISRPVSSLASLVTLPLVSPCAPASV